MIVFCPANADFLCSAAQIDLYILRGNDDGLFEKKKKESKSNLAGMIKNMFQLSSCISASSGDNFYHLAGNLYMIKTPEGSGQDKKSCIEDFIPQEWKGKKIGIKSFSPSNNHNHKTHYGKIDLAKKIILPNANQIDFSGFDPLLKRIIAVLDDYQERKNTINGGELLTKKLI